MDKQRADVLLCDRGLAESRTKAQALILAGVVFSGERRIQKPGDLLPQDIPLTIRERDHPYVSRGGLKLAHALSYFKVDPQGLTCLDIGASTGGFTDVLLRNGAALVYAVDVGRGQIAEILRRDPRVRIRERTNARYLNREQIPDPIDLIVCDASFISLKTILPAPLALAQPKATLIALIKPQFEVGREHVGKKGVVRDSALHETVCQNIDAFVTAQGWTVAGITPSPILGPEGNQEFLLAAHRSTTFIDESENSRPYLQ
ncbi:MAG: TlyA family RNA methyltransferase [Alphaproteobacteria bacterium]